MDKQTRVGLIGAGLIGKEHAKYLGIASGVELAAIADPTPAAQSLAEELGVPHFSDYEALLDSGLVDAVIVALPNVMHADATTSAVARGIVVLVEKPIADSLEDGRRILEAAEAASVPVLVGHQRRYAPDIAAAKAFIEEGGLGTIVSVAMLSTWRKPDEYFEVEWRRRVGGGPVLINLIHDIDVMRYLVGDIDSVTAMGSSAIRGFEVADTGGALFRFSNGAIGTASFSDAAASPWNWDLTSGSGAYFPPPPPGDAYFISGTKASIALPSLTVYEHEEGNHWQVPIRTRTLERRDTNPYIAQLEHLAAVVRGEAEPVISARDGFRSLAVAVAVDQSLATSPAVKVEK
ncbi:Gfo/Idh/MocA family oxidoreductase [Salinibacterium sp. SYSU T00001]|uniref:Gfo/Idh/MocA family protein n=1 Tax=Homoserinimonas sedimenticola TaxID=2986805 RepID=UPI002235DC1F|nr:Gfo/Idh/MocA family oxidoreductase [Salinibacterium sedimenticola]MCW4385487.1 Gfo/Idh/MocA family oxidoreductase [Salinibacterium sedimenticola]